MKTVAILQTKMGSTRLRGKSLMLVNGIVNFTLNIQKSGIRPGNYMAHLKVINNFPREISRFLSDFFTLNIQGDISIYASVGLLFKDFSLDKTNN